jgi:hypothetical protein
VPSAALRTALVAAGVAANDNAAKTLINFAPYLRPAGRGKVANAATTDPPRGGLTVGEHPLGKTRSDRPAVQAFGLFPPACRWPRWAGRGSHRVAIGVP